mgnify:CR=1 FL=1
MPKARRKVSAPLSVISDAVCVRCGCVCDDIELAVRENKVTEARNACAMGSEWFLSSFPEKRPVATIRGREVALNEALAEAGRILGNARFPLVHGLADATCEAQRIAVSIADRIGAKGMEPFLENKASFVLQEIPADEVRMGLRVEAVWVDPAELGPTLASVKYFRPTGEPDVPYEKFEDYL